VGDVSICGHMRNACKILLGKPKGTRLIGSIGIDRRIILN
jgi:hypothetical protein